MSAQSNSSGGVGLLGLLGIVFVVLKLTGFIDWSWWYVTMPFWGGLAVVLSGMVLYFVGGFIYYGIKALRGK